jgi:hypothetical protein
MALHKVYAYHCRKVSRLRIDPNDKSRVIVTKIGGSYRTAVLKQGLSTRFHSWRKDFRVYQAVYRIYT